MKTLRFWLFLLALFSRNLLSATMAATCSAWITTFASVPPSRDRRANHADLCAGSSAGRHSAARGSARGPRRSVRPWSGHARGSRLRRSLSGLQLDGLSRPRRFRRVRDGYDRLRPVDAARRHERPVQSLSNAQQLTFVPGLIAAPCAAVLRSADDDPRIRLERYRRGGRPLARAAPCGAGQHGGLVAGRSARRRIRRAASGKSAEAWFCSPRPTIATPRRNAARAGSGQWRRDDHAIARRIHRELGPAGRMSGPVRSGGERCRMVLDDGFGSGRSHLGHGRAASARR